MTINNETLRAAFGRFATGVCVVTTKPNNQAAIGMTINSFSSLSLSPPLVLWSIQNKSDCYDVFCNADYYAINILNSKQRNVANQYSRKLEHALDSNIFNMGEHGAPLISNSYCTLECKHWDKFICGDHTIIIGEVLGISEGDGEPLIFSSGNYLSN